MHIEEVKILVYLMYVKYLTCRIGNNCLFKDKFLNFMKSKMIYNFQIHS